MLTVKTFTGKYDNCIKQPCVLLVGGFDGLHAGHETLLAHAKRYALPVGVMSITGGKGEPLFTQTEREEIFARAGVDFCFFLSFDKIKDMTADEFCEFLTSEFCVRAFVCGEDFKFGKSAQGTPELLRKTTGIETAILPLLTRDGKKIGTTVVKNAIERKDLPFASALLQEKFFLKGFVVKDRGVGKTLGFPTANIVYPTGKYKLPYGVYQTETEVDGKVYQGITNFGARPTFHNEKIVTETYLDGFSGDLYGRELSVRFVRFLREIVPFESVEKLVEQLKNDVRRVQEND